MSDASTASWLVSLLPPSAASIGLAIWAKIEQQPWPIIVALLIGVFGIISLCVIAYLGYRSILSTEPINTALKAENPISCPAPYAIKPSSLQMPTNIGDKSELPNWQQLYEEYEGTDKSELRLKFLPDSADQASDALLLICYGYKIIRQHEPISIGFVHLQIEYLLKNALNSRQPKLHGVILDIARINAGLVGQAQQRDFGAQCVEKYLVERVGLAKGGQYKLTSEGEYKAKRLAADLIRRA